ncbi:ATP-dependent DNA helicase PIF1 [Prorops nasuta]|uniref:ATP-dependent DNA helicase PIF1 n=1 Tax=Prorops nasuta TaxID=863751 RepID=UPI0034CDED12
MDTEDSSVTCSVVLEWLNELGSTVRKINHRTATLRLVRNIEREIFVEVRPEKNNQIIKLAIKGISVFNKFMAQGKASIKFQQNKCTLFLSNAPSAKLIGFLKTIFIKMTGHVPQSKGNCKNKFALKSLEGIQEISPATSTEVNRAKEKALAVSRATVTTPSPSSVRKRKFLEENGVKIPTAKKLYENPLVGEMTEEQKEVLKAVQCGRNVFFTGSAGTGKSYLLKKIISILPPDVTVATASTGVAACHIGGITLHQFAGIGLGSAVLERCYQLASRPSIASIWRRTKHLVIDEISMVDGEFFDKIEAVARHIRRNDKPFGGIQLILCGDFFQLPPIAKVNDQINYCFKSESWKKCVHFNYELKIVHRQSDPEFVKILNSIRIGRVTEDITNKLKATANQKIERNGILATRLCSHIKEADEINNFQLDELKGEVKEYNAHDSDESMMKTLDQQITVPSRLILKIGAQVMLLKNININKGLVNGARGVVTKFVDGMPSVLFRSGTNYLVKAEKWSVKLSTNAIVYRKQLPLKLAWAFSIHKSQGLTLDCVEMCLSRVFDAGQSYVALSRAQSLDSLRVIDFNEQQVWVNTDVLQFYKNFRRNRHEVEIIPLGKKLKIEKKNNYLTRS